MALTLQPELSLPKELQISYPPEIVEWIKSNLPEIGRAHV